MSGGCDKCGLDEIECKCYLYELENRVEELEKSMALVIEVIQKLTDRNYNER